jgi:hypothetical protein
MIFFVFWRWWDMKRGLWKQTTAGGYLMGFCSFDWAVVMLLSFFAYVSRAHVSYPTTAGAP